MNKSQSQLSFELGLGLMRVRPAIVLRLNISCKIYMSTGKSSTREKHILVLLIFFQYIAFLKTSICPFLILVPSGSKLRQIVPGVGILTVLLKYSSIHYYLALRTGLYQTGSQLKP